MGKTAKRKSEPSDCVVDPIDEATHRTPTASPPGSPISSPSPPPTKAKPSSAPKQTVAERQREWIDTSLLLHQLQSVLQRSSQPSAPQTQAAPQFGVDQHGFATPLSAGGSRTVYVHSTAPVRRPIRFRAYAARTSAPAYAAPARRPGWVPYQIYAARRAASSFIGRRRY